MTARPVLELDDPIDGGRGRAASQSRPRAQGALESATELEPAPTADSALPTKLRAPRTQGRITGRARPAADAPALGERQGQTRFQVRLRDSMAQAVAETEAKIALEQPGLSLNEIREIAVWAMLADPSDTAVKTFVRDVIPDWLDARRRATHAARADAATQAPPS